MSQLAGVTVREQFLCFSLQGTMDLQHALEISFSQNDLQKICRTSRELETRSCANRGKHFTSQANIDTARSRPTVIL